MGGGLANSDEARSAAETGPGQRGSIGGAKQGINAVEEPAPDCDRGWSIRSEGQAGVRVRQEPALAKAGVRYRGLVKNTQRLALLLGLGNLLTAEQWAQIRPGSAGRANRRQPKTDWALTQGWISPQNLGVNQIWPTLNQFQGGM